MVQVLAVNTMTEGRTANITLGPDSECASWPSWVKVNCFWSSLLVGTERLHSSNQWPHSTQWGCVNPLWKRYHVQHGGCNLGYYLVRFAHPLSSTKIYAIFEGARWVNMTENTTCASFVSLRMALISPITSERRQFFKNHDGRDGKGPVSKASIWPFPIITALWARPGSGPHLSPASMCPPALKQKGQNDTLCSQHQY